MSDVQIFAVPSAGPVIEVIEKLERLLDEAREGRVRSFLAIYDTGPAVEHVISGAFDRFSMLGMAHRLAHRLQIEMDEDREGPL